MRDSLLVFTVALSIFVPTNSVHGPLLWACESCRESSDTTTHPMRGILTACEGRNTLRIGVIALSTTVNIGV